MKTLFRKLFFQLLLLPFLGASQSLTTPISIAWENGDSTLLSDLDPVWIILKKGSTIKNAKLREIQNKKGNLVYQKEGTLHDLSINNITRITAGNYSKSAIFFDDNYTPFIKSVSVEDYWNYNTVGATDFKVTVKAKKTDKELTKQFLSSGSDTKPVTPASSTVQETKIVAGNYTSPLDTIIKEDGEIIPAKILEITPTRIRFKKSNNMQGPSYVIGNASNIKILKHANSIKITIN